MPKRHTPAPQELLWDEDSVRDPWRDRAEPLSRIHFGTSTWAYPGWVGIVYSKKHRNSTDYLREYVRDPRFSTVGADFTFYSPPEARTLVSWLEFLPPRFAMVFKVWDELTVERFEKTDQSRNPRREAGRENPNFLSVELFREQFLNPFLEAGFEKRVAAFLFEFRASNARNPGRFLTRLEGFLHTLPKGFPYAVEIREPKLLADPYFSILRSAGVSHVFNHWDRMPSLAEQMRRGGFAGDRVISRILTPLGMRYEAAKKKFSPYNRLLPENVLPEMRGDVVAMCHEAIRLRLPGYILVNNRSEGCAPITIQAIEEALTLAPLPRA
ncbi:MAG: DUF72 domain-containing protein [Candidatus Omnitrophica bacterium]|nr:hypothetical protein [bacterium]NUN95558.1 DUF72 domain-containing protein [Candidatus Omnitrophota bacterium]